MIPITKLQETIDYYKERINMADIIINSKAATATEKSEAILRKVKYKIMLEKAENELYNLL
jgi:hypothetical protein